MSRAPGAGTQYRHLLTLVLRQHWVRLLAWGGPLVLLVAITAPSYEEIYPALSDRTLLVESLRANTATQVLYGPLPEPGRLGQLLVWETGTYVLILTALMGVLLAVTLIRRPEDTGSLELVRTTGTAPWVPTVAALTVLVGQCLLLGGGIAALLAVQAQSIEELTVSGALAFGAVVAAVGLAFALAGLVCCQLAPDASTARSWALAVLAGAFVARALPDAGADPTDADPTGDGQAALTGWHWVSPLGWVQVIGPYTEDRVWPFWVFGAVCLALLAVGLWLVGRREHQSGIVTGRDTHRRGMRVRSSLTFAVRRGLGSWTGWLVALAGVGALFGGMSSGMLELIERSDTTAELIRQLMGEGSVTSRYFQMIATICGILAGIYAVATVLRVRSDERSGLLGAELLTGRRRAEPLAAAWGVAVVGSGVLLALTGLVTAGVAAAELGEHQQFGQTVAYLVLQWPAAVCLAGLAAMLVAGVPRLSWIAWAVLAVAGTMTWFGQLLDLPEWLMELMVFNHVPDLAADDPVFWPLAVLAGLGVAVVLASIPLMQQRDVSSGRDR